MADLTLGKLVGTADNATITALLDIILNPAPVATAEEIASLEGDRVAYALFESRRNTYRKAISGRFGNVAWLRRVDGSYDDINAAAKIFNAKIGWRDCVKHADYDRIGGLVDAHHSIG